MSEIKTTTGELKLRKITITVNAVKGQNYVTKSYPETRLNKSMNPVDLYVVPSYKMDVDGVDDDGKKSHTEFEVLRFGVFLNNKPSPDYPSVSKRPIMVGMSNPHSYDIKEYKDYVVQSCFSPQRGAWVIKKNYYIHAGPQSIREVFATIGCIEICGPGKFNEFKCLLLKLSGLKESPYDYVFPKVAATGLIKCIIKKAPIPPLRKRAA